MVTARQIIPLLHFQLWNHQSTENVKCSFKYVLWWLLSKCCTENVLVHIRLNIIEDDSGHSLVLLGYMSLTTSINYVSRSATPYGVIIRVDILWSFKTGTLIFVISSENCFVQTPRLFVNSFIESRFKCYLMEILYVKHFCNVSV